MSAYEGPRWQEECFGCCECTLCPRRDNNNADAKRFVTVGSVRYGLRLGAVSPPPPGAGPRYRSQCCWPSALGTSPGCVSRIPLLTTSSIYSPDIFRCVNRFGMTEDTTSERETGRDQVLYTTKSSLKTQIRRRAFVRSQNYSRLFECAEREGANIALDRLPRFRFGGNRCTASGKPREKRTSDYRSPNSLKRQPVPPPRHKLEKNTLLDNPEPFQRVLPHRSASFSQVDYSPDDNKYVRRRLEPETNTSTLPRSKPNKTPDDLNEQQQQPPPPPPDIYQAFNSLDSPQTKKRDKSRRRKGIYISQWPTNTNSTEDVNLEIPKLQINEPKPDAFDAEEPLSPEENSLGLDWPIFPVRDESARTTHPLYRADSLSESEHDQKVDPVASATPSDVSDTESRISVGNDCRRYYKRPLRGPYGQMLEAEMKKPENDRKYQLSDELKFLEDLSPFPVTLTTSSSVGSGDPKPKFLTRTRGASNQSLDDTQSPKHCLPVIKRKVSADNVVALANERVEQEPKLIISHQRTTSSPSKLEGLSSTEVSTELLEQLLRGSSEQLAAENNQRNANDTRTHVVEELYDTERSYVESLQILVNKYLEPLKNPENAGLLDSALVDEIFFQIPSLLTHHQVFLDELKRRLDNWDVKQKVGDVFLEMFSKPAVIENYTNYVNNWKRAREILKTAQQSKPAFARFLEAMAREHKGKLALDSLLIKPIQKFPKYELLLQRLIKHTDILHPDYSLLMAAQKEVHEQLLKINCTEREALELEQLREIEGLIEGLMELAVSDRQYLRHDLVTMVAGGGTRKERALFLFSDLLLVTSIKRRSGTIRKPVTGQSGVTSTIENNKYKLIMKIALNDLEIVRAKDENLRQMMMEIEKLTEDISILNQINELTWSLHCARTALEDVIREMLTNLNRQLAEQQSSNSQLSCLDLTLNTPNGLENVSIVFSKPDKRSSWEETFTDAKQKLAISGCKKASPELVAAVPIRKTRAGLQFTCAAPAFGDTGHDVWVCNSDGYVGQVCILSLYPEPTVTSCNGVCNARILCIVSVPGINYSSSISSKDSACGNEGEDHSAIQFDSSSSSDECDRSDVEEHEEPRRSIRAIRSTETVSIDSDEADTQKSTMWLGTEDGCIHVYNSTDNIRIKKNKIKLQHGASVLCIIYLDERVFASLANGDVIIYERDCSGGWNVNSPLTVTVGSATMPVSKMLPNGGKLWCGCGNTIKVFNIQSLTTENSFTVNNDSNKHITTIVLSGNGVWLSLQNSAIVKCFHALTFENLCEVNVAPAVTKMLTSCDDIIRQHKAACLRVTSLLACKDLLWIGTSAGVLLTMPLEHISASTSSKLSATGNVTGVPHGHTGHVRFLACVDWQDGSEKRHSFKGKPDQWGSNKLLVISGGDGYEDFRSSNVSEVAGREDSTNHLLLWNI